MKVYDCFSYLDEDLLLELRLNIMDKFVDYFVIVKALNCLIDYIFRNKDDYKL